MNTSVFSCSYRSGEGKFGVGFRDLHLGWKVDEVTAVLMSLISDRPMSELFVPKCAPVTVTVSPPLASKGLIDVTFGRL